MIKRTIILSILFLSSILLAQEIIADYFGISGCIRCVKMESELEKLKRKYKNLIINFHDVSQPENYELMLAYAEAIGLKEELITIPVVFIGREYVTLETFASIEEKISSFSLNDRERIMRSISKYDASESVRKRFSRFTPFIIAFAGLVDGINPCAFVTLLFLFSFLSMLGKDRQQILELGLSFSIGTFIAYILLGVGLSGAGKSIQNLSNKLQMVFYTSLAVVFSVASFLSFYDAIRLGQGRKVILQLPLRVKRWIHHEIRERLTSSEKIMMSGFITGFLVSSMEFLCTGQIYLPTILYMIRESETTFKAFMFLIIYNLFFILPILGMVLSIYYGISVKKIENLVKKVKMMRGAKFVMGVPFMFFAFYMLNIIIRLWIQYDSHLDM